jgi:hypothetical protein
VADESNPTRHDGATPADGVIEVTVRMDVRTGVVTFFHNSANVVFVIGLLEYALLLIKRQDALRAALEQQRRIMPVAPLPRRIS